MCLLSLEMYLLSLDELMMCLPKVGLNVTVSLATLAGKVKAKVEVVRA